MTHDGPTNGSTMSLAAFSSNAFVKHTAMISPGNKQEARLPPRRTASAACGKSADLVPMATDVDINTHLISKEPKERGKAKSDHNLVMTAGGVRTHAKALIVA